MTRTPSNHMLDRMRRGETALGLGLRITRTPDIGRAMATAGIDWLFIDFEHISIDTDQAIAIALAAQDAGVTPIMRVPKDDLGLAGRLLDSGAMGIIMPHVHSAEDASRFARACRYPPNGHRSYSAGLPQLDFRPMDSARATALAEPLIGLFPQIESRGGADNVEAIVATPGVDGILLGLQDLSLDLGIPGQIDAPIVQDIARRCADACRKHGKFAGMGGTDNVDLIRRTIALGFRWILIGSDRGFLMQTVTERVAAIR